MIIEKVVQELQGYQFNLTREKTLQNELNEVLAPLGFLREYKLGDGSVIDFYHPQEKLGIEVKLKGNPMRIYKQCEKYCKYDSINEIMLISNKSMGFPEFIQGKKAYFFSLGRAWL